MHTTHYIIISPNYPYAPMEFFIDGKKFPLGLIFFIVQACKQGAHVVTTVKAIREITGLSIAQSKHLHDFVYETMRTDRRYTTTPATEEYIRNEAK